MNIRRILIVFGKELRDVTRDRKTLISMLLVPALIYPLIFIGFGALMKSVIEKAEREVLPICIIPADADSSFVAHLDKHGGFSLIDPADVRAALEAAAVQDTTLSLPAVSRLFSGDPLAVNDSVKTPVYAAAIATRLVEGIVEVAPGLSEQIAAGDSVNVSVYYDNAADKSEMAGDRLRDWARGLRDSLRTARLAAMGYDETLINPFYIDRHDVATPSKIVGKVLSMMLPYMLLILVVTGGMYAALDLTAGEKERNTLETILVSPASRFEIAAGMFLTTFVTAIITAMVALMSMGLTATFGLGFIDDASVAGDLAPSFSMGQIAMFLLLLVPVAMLFAALMNAIAIMAKSYKEGQSYVTPLIFLVILPAMTSFLPGVELNYGLALIPIVGTVMAMKAILLGTFELGPLLLVYGATLLYALAGIFVAAKVFERENVLFRT